MSFLNRIFGKTQPTGESEGAGLEGAVSSLAALYDDPEVKSERGLSLTGPRAEEVRGIDPLLDLANLFYPLARIGLAHFRANGCTRERQSVLKCQVSQCGEIFRIG